MSGMYHCVIIGWLCLTGWVHENIHRITNFVGNLHWVWKWLKCHIECFQELKTFILCLVAYLKWVVVTEDTTNEYFIALSIFLVQDAFIGTICKEAIWLIIRVTFCSSDCKWGHVFHGMNVKKLMLDKYVIQHVYQKRCLT